MRIWRDKNRDKVRDYLRAYTKQWRKKNPDADKAIQQRSYRKHYAQRLADVRAWQKRNPEKVRRYRLTTMKRYLENNPDALLVSKHGFMSLHRIKTLDGDAELHEFISSGMLTPLEELMEKEESL